MDRIRRLYALKKHCEPISTHMGFKEHCTFSWPSSASNMEDSAVGHCWRLFPDFYCVKYQYVWIWRVILPNTYVYDCLYVLNTTLLCFRMNALWLRDVVMQLSIGRNKIERAFGTTEVVSWSVGDRFMQSSNSNDSKNSCKTSSQRIRMSLRIVGKGNKLWALECRWRARSIDPGNVYGCFSEYLGHHVH